MPMERNMVLTEAFRIIPMISELSSMGKDIKTSMILPTIKSTAPPKYAEMLPITVPHIAARRVAHTATDREILPPYRILVHTSRP